MNDTNSYIVVLKPFILHSCQNDRTVGYGTKGAWNLMMESKKYLNRKWAGHDARIANR